MVSMAKMLAQLRRRIVHSLAQATAAGRAPARRDIQVAAPLNRQSAVNVGSDGAVQATTRTQNSGIDQRRRRAS
jgi:hypothetical protein